MKKSVKSGIVESLMAHENFSKIAQRIVGQISFRPTLSSWQDTVRVSKQFESKYEHWKIDNRQDITLFSPEEKKLLQILYNNVVYINEKVENFDELKEHIGTAAGELNGDSSNFIHLGVRNIQILGVKFEFNELVDAIYNKIYKSEILSISCDEPKDVLFSINAVKNNIRNNVILGPVTPEEAIQRFNSQFDRTLNNGSLPEIYKSYLFIDVDTHIREKNDFDLINNLIETNKSIIKDYIDYIK